MKNIINKKNNKFTIKIDKYCCQICNYVVISAKNKCEHILCDYCLQNIANSKIFECFLCQINKI
jgi:hypothetical protein